MTEHSYTLVNGPEGIVYSCLLKFLFQHASKCSLVVQTNRSANTAAQRFLDAVQRCLLAERLQSSWPGTVLEGGATGRVQYYTTNWLLYEEMTSAADRLYAWLFPMLPEDPAFYRSDGTLLMGTISHEHDAFLNLSDIELAQLTALAPQLQIIPSSEAQDT